MIPSFSDVNLATALFLDAFDRNFEKAVVVSNDSDLVAPIEAVRDRLRMYVRVLDRLGARVRSC